MIRLIVGIVVVVIIVVYSALIVSI